MRGGRRGGRLPRMSQTNPSRRRFLQSLAAAAAAGPFLSFDMRAAGATVRHASIGAAGQALSDLNAFARHPAFELVAVCDVDLCRIEPLQRRFPKVRVYQDWREMLEKERRNIDSVNVSIPDHMHCVVALEAMKIGKPVYVQKPLCNTLRETRLLTEEARRPRPDDADGHPGVVEPRRSATAKRSFAAASSARSAKSTRSRTRTGATTSRCRKPWIPCRRRSIGTSGSASGPSRPFKRGAYHPGEWRRRVGLRNRHARRHGLSHLQPAVSRAEADVADRRSRRTARRPAPRAGRRRRA